MKKTTTTKDLHEQRKVLWNESISAHRKYLDTETGLFADRHVENRKCPACGESDAPPLFQKEGGTYVKCGNCDMVFLNPVLKDEALYDFYKSNHTVQSEIVESDLSFYGELYNKGLQAIEATSTSPSKGRLLDIGCSSGIFLDIAREQGWRTYGVELNRREAEIAKTKEHTIYGDPIENINFDIKFNAVTLWDVFEHIKDGGAFLKTVKSFLSEDGIVFMQIPSSGSLAAMILHEKCNMFDGLEHVNLYCKKAVEALLDKNGFEILDCRTVISEIGVINNHLAYENPYLGHVSDNDTILGLLNEKQIHENLLGYKYQIVIGLS